ncbi:MAG: arylesterase [Usitatibacter sp.]
MRRLLVIFATALLLAGCGSKTKLEKLDSSAVVLAFGDSLTFGTGATPAQAYPAVLERAIGRKVVNAGVPGETSEQGLQRLPEVLDEVKPRLLILCHGGNDFLRRLDDGKAAANVRKMIEVARGRGIAVVLMGTPKPTLPPSIPSFYSELAKELKVPYEEAVLRSVLLDSRLKSDLVHPNAAGYSEIAAALEAVLKKAGAI